MGWVDLLTFLAGSAGIGVFVRQSFGFAKFVMKRRSLNAVMQTTKLSRQPEDWITAARALQMIDGLHGHQSEERTEPTDQKPSEPSGIGRAGNVEQLHPAAPNQGSADHLESG